MARGCWLEHSRWEMEAGKERWGAQGQGPEEGAEQGKAWGTRWTEGQKMEQAEIVAGKGGVGGGEGRVILDGREHGKGHN